VNHLLSITIIGLLSGITGTGIGGLSAFFVSKITNRIMSVILEFSAGLMTAVVCFKLITEAFELGGVLYSFVGIISGIIVVVLIENWLKNSSLLKSSIKNSKNTGLLRAGVLMAIAIALHNLPEGFAVGSGFEASASLGITITAVIMIHDIPEGIAMAVPLRAGGLSKLKAFTYTILSGVPMGLGALLGALLGEISHMLIASCLGFASGAMLYIVYGELLPESKRLYFGRLSSLGNVLGILCGIIVSLYN
jgi:ZIP family zinc transporter